MKKILLTILFLLLISCTSYAETYTIDNDGKERKKESCYGDSKLPSSYEGVEYYDCYLPYNLTCGEIGGYSNGVIAYTYSTYNYSMQSYYPQRIDQKFTYHVNGYAPNARVTGTSISRDLETGACLYTDSNGNQYYGTAIQYWFYDTSLAKIGWGSQNGQLVDVILTDGTVIHFVITDANAEAHTNGGPMESSLWNVQYSFADLKLSQYKNIYHAAFGNCIELTPWGTYGVGIDGFQKKFGLSEDGNQIAYYRLYNAKVSDNVGRKSGVPRSTSFNLGKVKVSESSSGNTKESNSVLDSPFIKDELDLHGMPEKGLISDNQSEVKIPGQSSNDSGLTAYQMLSVVSVRENMKMSLKEKIFYYLRILVVSLGLSLLMYIPLLVVCWLFDRINTFFDISLITLITFGMLKPTKDEEKSGEVISVKRLVRICIVCFLASVFLISGGVYALISRVLEFMSKYF